MNLPPNRKIITPVNLISSLLGVLLLVFLLWQIDSANLIRSLLSVHPGFLVLAGAAYLLKSGVRSQRFKSLNKRFHPGFIKMLRLTLASSLASQLLPLKLGELSYIYLIKREIHAPVAQGISSLLVVRIFDLLTISLLFILAALGFHLTSDLSVYFAYILGFFVLLMALLGGLIAAGQFFPGLAGRLLQTNLFQRFQVLIKLQLAIQTILDQLRGYSARQYLETSVYSALEWTLNYVMFHLLLQGLGLTPLLFDTITAVTFAALASVLPVNSFGNFGTQEAGWATGLILLGFDQETALTSGFATHLLSLVFMILLGGIAWITYLAGTFIQHRTPSYKMDER